MSSAIALRESWKAGKPVFGVWAALACPFAVELMSLPGVAYLCVDQQHGVIDYADAVNMMMAAQARGVAPLTRVPANESWMIAKALDAGAQGVIVPLVNNADEARAAVQACRYPPQGVRSFGPIRAAVVTGRDQKALGEGVLCFVMVETREGLANIEAIAATPGLDGIYVGPADLALGLGLPPDLDKTEPEHAAAVAAILDACRRNGIIAGIQCGSGKSAHAYAKQGFGLVTFTKDSAVLQAGVRNELRAALGQADGAGKQGYT